MAKEKEGKPLEQRGTYMTPASAVRRRCASAAVGDEGSGMRMPRPSVAS